MMTTIYDIVTGKINKIIDAPAFVAQNQAQAGESWVAGRSNDLTQYVSGGLIANRPEMPGSLDRAAIITPEAATLTGPEGAAITISGPVSGSDTMDADGMEISSDIPGIYTITVTLFPYLDVEYQLEITAP